MFRSKKPHTSQATKVPNQPDVPISHKKGPMGFFQEHGRLTPILIVCLVLGLSVMGGYIFKTWQNHQEQTNVETLEREYVDVQKEAENLIAGQKFDEAAAKWEEYINSEPDKEYRISAYLSLSTVYFASEKFVEAKNAAYKARNLAGQDTRPICLAIAYAAAETGDYQEAIDNYKKVLAFNEATIADEKTDFGVKFQLENDRDNYERIIKDLETKL